MAPMLIVAAISAAVSAAGAVAQGVATSKAASYNAGVARQNAQIAEAQGNASAEAQSRDAARKIGSTVAAYGASGVQMADGSAADVLADSASMAALDNATVRYNAKIRSINYQEQSALDDMQASNAMTSSYFGVANSALGLASAYYKAKSSMSDS